MNRKQKITLIVTIAVIIISLIIWQIYGGELFTKSQVLTEKKDELFGFTEKVWVNKFVWGLDLSLAISGVALVSGGIFYYIFKKKKS